jgi:hypothetical protein
MSNDEFLEWLKIHGELKDEDIKIIRGIIKLISLKLEILHVHCAKLTIHNIYTLRSSLMIVQYYTLTTDLCIKNNSVSLKGGC